MIECKFCDGVGSHPNSDSSDGKIQCLVCFGKGEITKMTEELADEQINTGFIKVIMPSSTNIRSNKVKFMVGNQRLPVTDFTISPDGERNIMKLTIKIDPNYFQIITEESE